MKRGLYYGVSVWAFGLDGLDRFPYYFYLNLRALDVVIPKT